MCNYTISFCNNYIKLANFLFISFNKNMKISSVNNIQNKQPVFNSCFRRYSYFSKPFEHFAKTVIRNSTNFFREDLNWNDLTKYIIEHFKDIKKVNAYSLACSDGSEAYSYAISIMENVPKALYSKFFPVQACDIDKEVLKIANSGRINADSMEFALISKNYNILMDEYLKDRDVSILINGDDISGTDEIHSYKIAPSLKNSVEFKQSDILTELKKLNDEGNSVIMCRNVFPYLSYGYVDEVLRTAKSKIKSGSLFVIGDYDKSRNIGEKLLSEGFFNPLKNNEQNSLIFERK